MTPYQALTIPCPCRCAHHGSIRNMGLASSGHASMLRSAIRTRLSLRTTTSKLRAENDLGSLSTYVDRRRLPLLVIHCKRLDTRPRVHERPAMGACNKHAGHVSRCSAAVMGTGSHPSLGSRPEVEMPTLYVHVFLFFWARKKKKCLDCPDLPFLMD